MPLKTIIIRWTGPYLSDEVCRSEGGNGIYLLTGRQNSEQKNQIQYCGITEDLFCNRINAKHHKIGNIRQETLSIWLGEVTYPARFKRPLLERAEHCFVSYLLPPLNDRKTRYYPIEEVCFISQWFTREGEPRLNHPPIVKDLPDVLWWDKKMWRVGKLRIWVPEE